MNKTTIPLFISGVLVGFGLCMILVKKDAPPKALAVPAPPIAARLEKVPVTPPTQVPVPAPSITKTEPATSPVTVPEVTVPEVTVPEVTVPDETVATRPVPAEVPAQASRIDLELTVDDVTAIEENLPELRHEVRLTSGPDGWHVRFYRPDNALVSIGVRDNDLIRYDQFDELKRDPEKANLVGRLENLLKDLQ